MRLAVWKSGSFSRATPEFYAALQNIGSEDALLNLGIMFGAYQEPLAIQLTITGPAGNSRQFQFRSKRTAGVYRGPVDDFIIGLPSGATYLLRLNLFEMGVQPQLELTDGRYRLSARYEGKAPQIANVDTMGVKRWPFWKGVIQSNSQEFETPAINAGSVLSTPENCGLTRHVRPVYPESALRAHIEGVVRVGYLITRTGEVTEVRALSGDPLLVPAAITAVAQWRYAPCRLVGPEPVERRLESEVSFTLSQ
jgi:TonB family protein